MPFIQDQHGRYSADGVISADDILREAAAITTRRNIGRCVDPLKTPADATALFKARLQHLEHEEFHVAFLDTRHRVIAIETLSRGTIDGAEVHPREVVKAALMHNAAAAIASHNHPSGVADPSAADRAVTARLKQALALVDIRLLDHIVIGDEAVSLASRGWV